MYKLPSVLRPSPNQDRAGLLALPPPIGSDTWRDFLAFLRHSTASHPSAFEAIVGYLPIKSATFPVLIALLRAGVKLSASPDGSVRLDLLSAG
mmetsp:Transcript_18445/g.28722  ORF Transcript_18445/g.28722 Transcript_18445/m.28722 type:complete len:93 (+) Transcript_18445:1370-1648(+)